MEIVWIKLDAGEYESEDKRFYIIKTYDNLFGHHWVLFDNYVKDYYQMQYHGYSLKECKEQAVAFVTIRKKEV